MVLNIFNVLYLLNHKFGDLNLDRSKEKEFIKDIDSASEFYYLYFSYTYFTSILDNQIVFLEMLLDVCDEILDIVFCSRILLHFIGQHSFDNKQCLTYPNCPISKLLEEKQVCYTYVLYILFVC